jgi:hypothetical protein
MHLMASRLIGASSAGLHFRHVGPSTPSFLTHSEAQMLLGTLRRRLFQPKNYYGLEEIDLGVMVRMLRVTPQQTAGALIWKVVLCDSFRA